ncbi:acyl-CoA dehydrogenase family protein [Candidatus Marimicrobium litorale]|uniref:Acyl-CoA dehydrogenase n=1 Tax=Candidatus Marimicrobium litorale TaxID=2518991 RepID=A0ABT3T5E2_9GAMM|nr:acyl-CoA/acyl-ACP dehydrogenase [Candidatus Marimicrobium litorale]MCX2977045.1 acyl-CoA dehydrogenase [Candidatus Marimicrobium litorale]
MAALTEEQTLIREQASAWALKESPVSQFRALRDASDNAGFEQATWDAMIEMGWTGILIPEEYGGSDLGILTFGLVLEQLGRQLTASPLLPSALAGASALLLGGSAELKEAMLPKIIDGTAIVTLAVDEGTHHRPESTALEARASEGGFTLVGSKASVAEGSAATHFVVAARTAGTPGEDDGISLFLLPADSAGVSRTPLNVLDSRDYANIRLDDVHVDTDALLGRLDGGLPLLQQVLDRARAGIAAEMLGTASQAFDMTLDYLKTREQFGKVIGSFQGLGHRAAGLFSAMEQTRSCVEAALQAIDTDADNSAELASLAKCRAGQFLYDMTNELIQMHGGIGMTDEFDAGLYLKRARALEASYGNRSYHRDRYARLLGF